jgi:hypothetical protein
MQLVRRRFSLGGVDRARMTSFDARFGRKFVEFRDRALARGDVQAFGER